MKILILTFLTANANMLLPFLLEDIEDENLKMMMLMNSMGVQQSDPISQMLPLMLLQAKVRDYALWCKYLFMQITTEALKFSNVALSLTPMHRSK